MTAIRPAVKFLLSLLVAAACLWLAARQVQLAELRTALAAFDHWYVIPLVAISLAIQVFRALRWKIELKPLRDVPFSLTWEVVAVAYMMINVLPFRLGEPVRPLLMSWKSGLPVPAIVGNWVFEKMMDSAALVLFVHLALISNDLPEWAHKASEASLLAFAVLAAIVVGFWRWGEGFFSSTLGRVLPAHASAWTLRVLSSARAGLSILPDSRQVATVFTVTIALWSLPVLSSFVLMLGFGFDLPFAAALVVFVAIGVGTALPAPPGMVGVFQIASVVALGLFGIPKAEALAYGILLNAVQFLTLVAQGLVALPLLGVSLGEITRAALTETEHGHA